MLYPVSCFFPAERLCDHIGTSPFSGEHYTALKVHLLSQPPLSMSAREIDGPRLAQLLHDGFYDEDDEEKDGS